MIVEIILGVVSDDPNNPIAKELDNTVTPIEIEIGDYDEFVNNISKFVEDELQDNGVYEFDEWDEDKSMIQIGDDGDDNSREEIISNYEEVIRKVKDYLTKQGLIKELV